MSNSMNLRFLLFSSELNQSITAKSFFHCVSLVFTFRFEMILASFNLETLPNSAFVGLINLVSGELGKFSL